MLILDECCAYVVVVVVVCVCVVRHIAPLGVDVDAVVVRVPSHVAPVRKGRHRQWRCHLQARSLVLDTEYYSLLIPVSCFIACLLLLLLFV